MNKLKYGRKKRRKPASPMDQHYTRLSLIKYMFRVRDDQKQADILMGSLWNLKEFIRITGMSHADASIVKRKIHEMELIVRDIQKGIGTDE